MSLGIIFIIVVALAISFFLGTGLALGEQKKFRIPPVGTAVFIGAVLSDGSFVAEFLGKRRYYKGNTYYRGSKNHKYLFRPMVGNYIVESRSEYYCPGTRLYWDEMQKIDD